VGGGSTRWGFAAAALGALLLAQEDPAIQARRGKQAMAEGRFADAARIYSELTRQIPGNPGLLLNLGMAHAMAGAHQEAVAALEAALKIDSSILPANLFLGGSYLKLGQPARAIAPLQRVVALQPEMRDAVEMLADATLATARYGDAVRHHKKWTELDASNPKAWIGLSKAYAGLADRAFAAMEKIEPGSAYSLVFLAEMQEKRGRAASAFQLYRKALTKKPDLGGAHTAIARIYREAGHADWAASEEAKEPRPAAQKPKPGSVESYYRELRSAEKAATEAFAHLEKLPPTAEIHQFLAENARAQGRHLEEVEHWRAALKLAPGNRTLEVELAYGLHLARDHQGAQQVLERLVQKSPASARLNFMLGDTLLALQKPQEALPYLEKGVAGDKTMLAAQAALGRALMQLGRPEQALAPLKAALPSDKDGTLHFQLAQAHRAAGQDELARQALAEYQKLRAKAGSDAGVSEEAQITPPER
jgi:predicted Zn-dependent protease